MDVNLEIKYLNNKPNFNKTFGSFKGAANYAFACLRNEMDNITELTVIDFDDDDYDINSLWYHEAFREDFENEYGHILADRRNDENGFQDETGFEESERDTAHALGWGEEYDQIQLENY